MRPWGPTLALAAGLAGNGCLVELDRVLACGDGYVDLAVGEECDPNDPDEAYKSACPNNNGGCDPKSCQIINDEAQCAKCGDGVIDVAAGEECDGSNIGVQCWGDGQPTCTPPSTDADNPGCKLDFSSCDPCGNRMVEPEEGEECDAVASSGDLVAPVQCAGTFESAPLPSPYLEYPYTSGQTVSCLPNCTYDRTNCAYCGNGTIDGPLYVSLVSSALSLAEVCDGDVFNPTEQAQSFPLCAELDAWGNVECNANCLGYTPREGPACCLPKNSPCPAEGDSLRCCYEYANPGATELCLPVIVPTGDGGGEGGGSAVVCR